MKAIVIHGAKDLRIQDAAQETPGPGQVAIEMAAGGICGSDLHYYQHGGFGAIKVKQPMVLGHEVSGRIAEIGAGVDDLSVGDLVAVSPSRPCATCEYCQKGLQNHCINMRFYGSAMPFPHIQGAFQQHLVADAAQCYKAPNLGAEVAAMAEPLAVVLHGLSQAGSLVGKTVLVTGCGPIGQLVIVAAKRAGATCIIATDLSDFTLGMALQSGADRTVNVLENPSDLDDLKIAKGQVDVHLECSGAGPAVSTGVECLRPTGILVQLGLGGDMQIPLQMMTAKEISLRGSFRFHTEFSTAVDMLNTGMIRVDHLITDVIEMDQAVQAFELASDRTRAMKIALRF